MLKFCFTLFVLSNLQVRRTRISERMRKLQDLVPNMDKVGTSLCIFPCKFLCRDHNVSLLLIFTANKHSRHVRFGR